jgi:hypothetical protein
VIWISCGVCSRHELAYGEQNEGLPHANAQLARFVYSIWCTDEVMMFSELQIEKELRFEARRCQQQSSDKSQPEAFNTLNLLSPHGKTDAFALN